MLTSIELKNFKGHRDTRLNLFPLTVLVGPNGSGKTSVLQAIRALGRCRVELPQVVFGFEPPLNPRDVVLRGPPSTSALLRVVGTKPAAWQFDLELVQPPTPDYWRFKGLTQQEGVGAKSCDEKEKTNEDRTKLDAMLNEWRGKLVITDKSMEDLRTSELYRFNSSSIAEASPRADQVGASGENLAAVLANMRLREEPGYEEIKKALSKVVPTVENFRIDPVPLVYENGAKAEGYRVLLDFRNAHGIPATGASEGTLLTLAVLTVLHTASHPNVVLLDDLDKGLHPSAQIQLLKNLRELQTKQPDLQIIVTTHSPFIVDEVPAEAVWLFRVDDSGWVRTKQLSQHPDYARWKEALKAGEFWSQVGEDWV